MIIALFVIYGTLIFKYLIEPESALQWWHNVGREIMPRLNRVAHVVLSTPASEIEVECVIC